ncbi:bar adaptor protein [Grosmannia clavigera kw1407]|uniref:Bar adaptor protein n=1 Tax=Grosmannia clavigera (strain kw1407 / UAMH 11150) TaxID=655863 RepID=F0XSS3_GROCL|nr:bar adaptor protein [Grosmannia clavigera kw1407]EFW99216.1 bar adaptor protein [Grosmannia clavigera kw1407]
MSFRGFQKSVVRAPQQFKAKFNIGEHTKDSIYLDAERRFDEVEKETKKLHDESKHYADAINGMLSHQIEFSRAMTEVYKPISGSVSDPESYISESNEAGIRACEEYEAVVKDLQETLAPELEMIETRVIRPANELLDVIRVIRKTAVKREHKKLDYDRHRLALKKLQDKKEKSLKDEKALYKAESDLEQSAQDFNYFNDLLKDELPKLFHLERQFIQPLFQSFYYMQLNVFYTLHEKMQQCDIGYFDLTRDIEEAFESKRGAIQDEAEKLTIVHFRKTGGKRPLNQSKYGTRPALEAGPRPLAITAGPSSSSTYDYDADKNSSNGSKDGADDRSQYHGYASASSARRSEDVDRPPPPYSAIGSGGLHSPSKFGGFGNATSSSGSTNALAAAVAAKSKPPPPPKPKPTRLSAVPAPETVTALYDYAAAQEGDLGFRAGDVIEIVTRTGNANEWWEGKLNGRQGQFPGNYVQLNS